MAEKLLAEWFLTDRWRGSSAALLPMEPRGLYREMLSEAWRRGARLPNDHQAIQRALGATAEVWGRCWPLIEPYWRAEGAWLINDTQAEVYADAKARADRATERGLRGAKATAQARAQAGAQAQARAPLKHQPPSPSPSPSVRTTNERTNERTERANPLLGDRTEREREALRLVARLAEINGTDPAEEFADAAHYKGAERRKVNPAAMSEDRLLNTLMDLRANVRSAEAKIESKRLEAAKRERAERIQA